MPDGTGPHGRTGIGTSETSRPAVAEDLGPGYAVDGSWTVRLGPAGPGDVDRPRQGADVDLAGVGERSCTTRPVRRVAAPTPEPVA